jgi:multiple sugar transport system permease protein
LKSLPRVLIYLALAVGAVFALFPIYWMVITALKPASEIFSNPPTFWPHHPILDNFVTLFRDNYMSSYVLNSIIVVGASVASALVLGSLASYSLARFKLWRSSNERLGFAILAVRMMPPIVIIVPVFLTILGLGLLNTHLGLILVYTALNLPFVVWMMRSFIEEIPPDLEEAALTDGATRITAMRTVLLPLAVPGLVATSIFAVVVTYNEFIFALILTSTPDAMTVPVGSATLIGKISLEFGPLAAAGVVALLPILVFALVVQRHLVRGLTMGALK